MLDAFPNVGTRVSFSYVWERAPLADRLMAPFVRWVMGGGLHVAMKRVAVELDRRRLGANASAARR